jgi:hypothetical protein
MRTSSSAAAYGCFSGAILIALDSTQFSSNGNCRVHSPAITIVALNIVLEQHLEDTFINALYETRSPKRPKRISIMQYYVGAHSVHSQAQGGPLRRGNA